MTMRRPQKGGEQLRELTLGELREAWVIELHASGELSCDDLRSRLRARGLKAKGNDRKGEIRNIHSAATSDKRIVKLRPGVFGLARRSPPGPSQ